MKVCSLSAILFKLTLPLDGVDVRLLTFTSSSQFFVHRRSFELNGFRIELSSNIIVIYSSQQFDDEYASFIRIPIISWSSHINSRSIMGYYIVSNDGSLKIWCKRFSFGHQRLPDIYMGGLLCCIAITFTVPFLAVPIAYRHGYETDVNPTMFMLDRLTSTRRNISHQSAYGGHFVVFEDNLSPYCRQLAQVYNDYRNREASLCKRDANAAELCKFSIFSQLDSLFSLGFLTHVGM